MNYKFGIKIAALLATFTGTSIGPTTVLPSDWLSSAHAQPPIITPDQAQPRATSNMLAPIVPPVVKKSDVRPWEVDPSRYQSAIDPNRQNRPALVSPAQLNKNTAWVPAAPAKSYTPQIQQAVTKAQQSGAGVQQAFATEADAARSKVQQAAAVLTAPAKAQIPGGFSAAGVPLYSGARAVAGAAPTFAPGQAIANAATAPIARAASAAAAFAPPAPTAPALPQGSGTRGPIGFGAPALPQGSGTRGAIGSGIAPGPSFPAPPIISQGSELLVGPSDGSGTRTAPSSVLTPGPTFAEPTFVGPTGPAPVVADPPAFTSAPVANDVGTAGAVGCGTPGGCNCGPGGCFNEADIANQAGLYGSVGEARFYGHLEAMIVDRQDGEIFFTPSLQLGDRDADFGFRVTLGERFDAINGREVSYWGTADISNSATLTGDIFPLDQVFQTTDTTREAISPFGFITAATATPPSTLIRPTEQTHSADTSFHTIEFNRVRWAWDVFKSFAGIRYLYLNDRYELNSTATVPDPAASLFAPGTPTISSGTFTTLAQNHLIGPHIGGEWFYDVGYRLSASLNLKGGIYANLNEVDTRLFRDGDAFVDTESENTEFASSLEFGLHAHYQIAPRGRFRLGFNVLHLEDVATVNLNFPATAVDSDGALVRSITRGTGTAGRDDDDITFTAFSFGLEFFR